MKEAVIIENTAATMKVMSVMALWYRY